MAIEAARVGAIILAAGLSRRFGEQDKLAQPLGGEPLLSHATKLLFALPFAARILVSSFDQPARGGITQLANQHPERGMGHSLAIGLAAVGQEPVDACLVLLGDMPLVTVPHLRRLLDAYEDDPALVASMPPSGRPMVPALFGRRHFAALRRLTGDRGAQQFFTNSIRVPVDDAQLIDIDTPEDLLRIQLRTLLRAPSAG